MDDDVKAAFEELAKFKRPRKKRSQMAIPTFNADKSEFMLFSDVLESIPISRSTIYNMMERGEFPKPVKLGRSRMAWLKQDVMDWIGDRIAERPNGNYRR